MSKFVEIELPKLDEIEMSFMRDVERNRKNWLRTLNDYHYRYQVGDYETGIDDHLFCKFFIACKYGYEPIAKPTDEELLILSQVDSNMHYLWREPKGDLVLWSLRPETSGERLWYSNGDEMKFSVFNHLFEWCQWDRKPFDISYLLKEHNWYQDYDNFKEYVRDRISDKVDKDDSDE